MIIDGKKIAEQLREKVKNNIDKISGSQKPGLTVILIGDHPASQIYVRNKEKFAKEVGINSKVLKFDESITEQELKNEIENLNKDFCISQNTYFTVAQFRQISIPRINTNGDSNIVHLL